MLSWYLVAALCWATPDPDALIDEARRRAVIGDFEGVRIVAEEALAIEGDHQPEARYLLAIGFEYDHQPTAALPHYEQLLTEFTDPNRLNDVRFRHAESLGASGRRTEALQEILALQAAGIARTPSDEVKLALLEGLWRIDVGGRRGERDGLSLVQDTLSRAAVTDAPTYQAMARSRLVELAAAQAEQVRFKGPPKKKARQLELRASLVGVASDQLVALVRIDVPRHTLGAFEVVGDAHASFGQAMLDESRVRGLNADQRAIYVAERAQRVVQVWVKASRYYDRGLQYAETVGWRGEGVASLQDAHAEILEHTEALEDGLSESTP